MYHVILKLSTAETQNAAMACSECTEDIAINIEATEDIREKLQLYSFTSLKNVFVSPQADFSFSVENTGNKSVVPSGKIRIFDNSGKEVGLVDLNIEGKQIEPKAKDLLAASWAANGKFGKYKALLDVSYGQRGTMQDVVYFWVIPWFRMLMFVFTIALVMIITMLFIRSRSLARPAYSYQNYEDEEAEVEDEVEEYRTQTNTAANITLRNNRNNQPVRLDDSMMHSRTSQLTEVNIPPRIRTVPPNMSVQIDQRKSQTGEEHVIRLK